jgi:hypothetical protein
MPSITFTDEEFSKIDKFSKRTGIPAKQLIMKSLETSESLFSAWKDTPEEAPAAPEEDLKVTLVKEIERVGALKAYKALKDGTVVTNLDGLDKSLYTETVDDGITFYINTGLPDEKITSYLVVLRKALGEG